MNAKLWMVTEWLEPGEAIMFALRYRDPGFEPIVMKAETEDGDYLFSVCREARPGEVVPAEHNLLREYPKARRVKC